MAKPPPETLALCLSTRRRLYRYNYAPSDVHPIPVDIVVDLDVPGSNLAYLEQSRHQTPGDAEQRTWRIEMQRRAVERIHKFFKLTMVEDNEAYYACHSLTYYAMGKRHSPALRESDLLDPETDTGDWVPPNRLNAGEPYMMINEAREAGVHSVLGFGDAYPRHSLSVLGGFGPLAVTNTIQVAEMFDAQRIVPMY